MQEEVSTSMRIAITVWMTGAFLGVVTVILVMCLGILNDYSNTYNNAVVAATESSITSSVKDESRSGALIYASIDKSISSIDAVRIDDTYIYKYDDGSCQNLMCLLTTNKNKQYKVTVKNGDFVSTLKTVVLTEVP